jgi:predicted CxxxxCH...CXXCH cytochrome family protein
MKRLIIPLVSLVALFGCAELKDDVAAPEEPATTDHSMINIHAPGVNSPKSDNFHGALIRNAGWSFDGCVGCHAENLTGDEPTDLDPTCWSCHNPDDSTKYVGVDLNLDCTTCHTYPGGPKSCNTCHGNFANPRQIAPPVDLDNNIAETERGVGAHAAHLYDPDRQKVTVVCNDCHIVPKGYDDAGHIDQSGDDPAEVDFTTAALAVQITNHEASDYYDATITPIEPNPSYDASSGTCANVYCHGEFKNGNLSNVVSWTAGANGAKCGSCHGDAVTGDPLPAGDHPNVANCSICHGDVATGSTPGAYEIGNKNLHVDGKLRIGGLDKKF